MCVRYTFLFRSSPLSAPRRTLRTRCSPPASPPPLPLQLADTWRAPPPETRAPNVGMPAPRVRYGFTPHSRVSLDTSYIFSLAMAATTPTTPLLHTASVVADFRAIDEGELSVKQTAMVLGSPPSLLGLPLGAPASPWDSSAPPDELSLCLFS